MKVEHDTTSPPLGTPATADLRRLTATVQHQLNNPLAALLAEAQLLRLEPDLADHHAEAVDRMIEIVRRIIALVRDLERPGSGSAAR
ncbi:MAG TPA: histidine kinase dimerization/phospho-acceptor domain-containing protein [Gemmatimonadaceae bacterium]|nr:histidine kinase dimerization/phospho-acceptor domain-containing protein [Gemmatimonadaceae bacterium]